MTKFEGCRPSSSSKIFNKNFVRRKIDNIRIQYRHTQTTVQTKYSPVCIKLIYIIIEYQAVNEVFAHELRRYNRKDDAVSTGTVIITSVFGWRKNVM